MFAGRLEEACLFLSRVLDAGSAADIDALIKLVSAHVWMALSWVLIVVYVARWISVLHVTSGACNLAVRLVKCLVAQPDC